MKQLILSLIIALGISSVAYAQQLKFSQDGEFKIVQVTDTHYKRGDKNSNDAVDCIAKVLDAEKPDLVVFTGDQIYKTDSVGQCLKALLQPVIDRGVPFAVIFGNHDSLKNRKENEVNYDLTRSEMYDLFRSLPGCVMPERGGVESPDYALAVSSNDGLKNELVLYFFDSNVTTSNPELLGKYDWVRSSQIDWYCDKSKSFAASNGGEPLPSVMFLHIPLPEYMYAYNLAQADGKVGELTVGVKGEEICCPEFNSGLFTAAKIMGDVYGVFCGHDHKNDFAVAHENVLLAYGRYSGGKTVNSAIKPNGARVILLKEGSKTLDTWIRLIDGTIKDKATFDSKLTKL